MPVNHKKRGKKMELRELIDGLFSARLPIHRYDRNPSETEYYFLDYDKDQQYSVPDGVDPITFRNAGYRNPAEQNYSIFTTGLINSNSQNLLGAPAVQTSDVTNQGNLFDSIYKTENMETKDSPNLGSILGFENGNYMTSLESDIPSQQGPMSYSLIGRMCYPQDIHKSKDAGYQKVKEYLQPKKSVEKEYSIPELTTDDKKMLEQAAESIVLAEGPGVNWGYLDHCGNKTMATGFLISSKKDLYDKPLYRIYDDGTMIESTKEDKDELWDDLDESIKSHNFEPNEKNGYKCARNKVNSGKQQTEFAYMYMLPEDVVEYQSKVLNDKYNTLKRSVKNSGVNWDDLDSYLKIALMHIAYQKGLFPGKVDNFGENFKNGKINEIMYEMTQGVVPLERKNFLLQLGKRSQQLRDAKKPI